MIKGGIVNGRRHRATPLGVWDKGNEEIWLLFYWDSVIENYLKANYV